jgi:carboxymethylenebutenolidase
MTELERYLAEEVAEDHVDGIITRREAMRRLGLLGLSTTAASAMIAAEAQARTSGRKGGGHGHHHDHGDGKSTTWAPPATQAIKFPGPRGPLMAAWAPATKARGGVLVIHENRGLTPHIAHVASRWAASGWSALALDLLSEEGGTGSFGGDEGAISARLSQISSTNPGRFDEDMKAAITELAKRVGRRSPLGATGFCFGGGMVWRLLAAREPRLSAAAPFYGPFPTGGSLKGNKANVLGIYAGNDSRVNDTREAARQALEAARLDYELLTFTEQDATGAFIVGHAFFNDTGARFNPAAAEEAWRRVVSWFNDAGDDRRHHH